MGKEIRSTDDALARRFIPESGFVIFFPYGWINGSSTEIPPDDAENTQYKPMMAAIERFLKLQPEVEPERLRIWLVSPRVR